MRILNESIKHKLLQKNRSVKLNPYLAKISPHLNVRLFRTWLASCYYIEEINNLVEESLSRLKTSKKAVSKVAKRIFNTPKNAFGYYIHPHLIHTWMKHGKRFGKKNESSASILSKIMLKNI